MGLIPINKELAEALDAMDARKKANLPQLPADDEHFYDEQGNLHYVGDDEDDTQNS